jgi:hypothetical protein
VENRFFEREFLLKKFDVSDKTFRIRVRIEKRTNDTNKPYPLNPIGPGEKVSGARG